MPDQDQKNEQRQAAENRSGLTVSRRKFLIAAGAGAVMVATPTLFLNSMGGRSVVGQTTEVGMDSSILGEGFKSPPTITPSLTGEMNVELSCEVNDTPFVVQNPFYDSTSEETDSNSPTRTYVNLRNYRWADLDEPGQGGFGIPGPTFKMPIETAFNVKLINNLGTDGQSGSNQCDTKANSPKSYESEVDFPECFHGNNTTNLHFHGSHTSPKQPGDDVLIELQPGIEFQFEYFLPWNQSPGTHWYHPHKHGSTAIQMFNGMSGTVVVTGAIDQTPGIRGIQEQVLVIQKIMDDDGWKAGGFVPGAVNVINGQFRPVISMQPGEVQRWRFLAATVREEIETEPFSMFLMEGTPPVAQLSNSDTGKTAEQVVNPTMPVAISDSQRESLNLIPMYLFERDGVPRSRFTTLSTTMEKEFKDSNPLVLSPAGRADVLVQIPKDAAPGTIYTLVDVTYAEASTASPSGLKIAKGINGNLVGNGELAPPMFYQIMGFVQVQGDPVEMALPSNDDLPSLPWFLEPIAEPPVKRYLAFSVEGGGFQGAPFQAAFFIWVWNDEKATWEKRQWMRQVNDDGTTMTAELGVDPPMILNRNEEWTVFNISVILHPFHIHINPFQVVELNDPTNGVVGQALEDDPNGPFWQDTINLPIASATGMADVNAVIGDPTQGVSDALKQQVGYVRMRHRFLDFTGAYVIHCHNLGHEDNGMMLKVQVDPPNLFDGSGQGPS